MDSQTSPDRLPMPSNGSRAVASAGGLGRLRVPSRNESVRRLVAQLYRDNAHLSRGDLWATTRYATLCWKFRRLAELMDQMGEYGGFLRKDGEPRKVLGELRQLSDSITRLEESLALTVRSQIATKVNVLKGQTDLARLLALPEGDGDG